MSNDSKNKIWSQRYAFGWSLIAFFLPAFIRVFIFAAYSFQSYQCFPKKPDTGYTTEQYEKEQIRVDCPADKTCIKYYSEEEQKGEGRLAWRGCVSKIECDKQKAQCADEEKKKEDGTTLCLVTCCVSDGDIPCNSGPPNSSASTVTTKDKIITMMVMIAVLAVFC